MTTFVVTSKGIEAGWNKEGFFAFGTTIKHEFQNRDGHFSIPPISGMPVNWRIDAKGEDAFESYKVHTYPQSDLTPRMEALEEFFERYKPAYGQFRRWSENEPIELHYSVPNDPTLAAFIMGVVAADRELVIAGQGFRMLYDDDRLAPAPSVAGFMERKEPLFLTDIPTLRMK